MPLNAQFGEKIIHFSKGPLSRSLYRRIQESISSEETGAMLGCTMYSTV
jgi:hypothetical protein